MPDNDQPMWPSSDEDRSSGGGGKTTPMSLPDPPPTPPEPPAVPKVTADEGPASWFKPNVQPDPIPAVTTPPAPPSPPKRDLADRLSARTPTRQAEEPKKQAKAPSPEEAGPHSGSLPVQQKPENGRQAQQAEQPKQPDQQPKQSKQSKQPDQPKQQPARPPAARQNQQQWSDQSTQQMPAKPQPSSTPWVPVERDVWPGDAQADRREPPARPDAQWSQRIDVRENRSGDRPAEPGERTRGLPPEPPRGVVPSASAGSLARPMRIEPDGRQFEAEATVGIERPADFPDFKNDRRPQQPQQPQQVQRPQRPPAEPPRAEPPRAEPPRTEPPRAESPSEPPAKKRKGKLILIGALVLVVLLGGLGFAATRPSVSNRLALPWAPNAPKGEMPEPVAATRVLQGPDTAGQAPTENGVKSVLSGPAGNSALAQLSGSVIDAATGTEVWDRSASKAVTPASTTKILTAAAALLSLDHGMRLSTKIVHGADPGTVILVGGGDTTLTGLPLGTASPLYPGAAHVDDLVAQVKKALPGVKKVQVDLGLFKGPTTAAGWEAGDAPSKFATQMAPVMADGGRQNPKDNESQRVANAGSAVASTIASKLSASAGGQATAPKDAKVLAEVKSAPLTELVADTLELSDDTLADAIARQVALANGEEASYTGGAAATLKVLKAHNFDVSGVVLSDGSGISMQNRIPARLLAKIIALAAASDGKNPDTATLRPMLDGLPVAGGSGTLADDRFDKPDSEGGKGWVRAKTGTLSGVNTLAGLVLDQDGRVLVFAMMSEGSDKLVGRAGLDVIAAALRKCGCQ